MDAAKAYGAFVDYSLLCSAKYRVSGPGPGVCIPQFTAGGDGFPGAYAGGKGRASHRFFLRDAHGYFLWKNSGLLRPDLFIGYGNGIFHRLYLDEDIKLPMVWIAFSDLAYGLLLYFFLFMFRGRFDFVYYLIHIIIPELIYTVVVTLGLYWLIRRINQWLEKHEEDLPVTEEI